jgi:hypothetical protein
LECKPQMLSGSRFESAKLKKYLPCSADPRVFEPVMC